MHLIFKIRFIEPGLCAVRQSYIVPDKLKMVKKIGILTSGGDCAGLNAVIRSTGLRAINHYGWEVYGIRHGIMGLMRRPVDAQRFLLPDIDNADFLRKGGTILGATNRGDPFAFPVSNGEVVDRSNEVIEGYYQLGLDALIGVGGDGSLDTLNKLAIKGNLNLVGIPKTIDNDLGLTENSIGFSTAVEVATEALDRLQPTAASHDRVMILQVMGRDAGHIALHAGIAGGADIILIPEIKYKLTNIYNKIQELRDNGRNFALIIVAEAVKKPDGDPAMVEDQSSRRLRYAGIGECLADYITSYTDAETRVTVLGHLQRGSPPNAQDRLLASALGVHAVDLVAAGKFARMVAWRNREVIDVAIQEAVDHYQTVDVDGTIVKTARSLGICFGD